MPLREKKKCANNSKGNCTWKPYKGRKCDGISCEVKAHDNKGCSHYFPTTMGIKCTCYLKCKVTGSKDDCHKYPYCDFRNSKRK